MGYIQKLSVQKYKMEERITKLLILVGDEGSQHQKRDFDRIVAIIVDEYLAKNEQNTEQIITSKLTQVIGQIPLKQHLYAGLTAKISLVNKNLANQIIQTAINHLQSVLGEFDFYQSINIITYLSELMNIMLLNSLTFMNVLEDVLDQVEGVGSANAKKFYVGVLVRVLPMCVWSLSEKLFPDLKKFMDLLESHVQNDSLFGYLKGMVNRGKIVNFSLTPRLQDKFQGIPQFNFKRKLKIQPNLQKSPQWTPIQYFPLAHHPSDQLYKQFCQQQGLIHQLIIQHLIQTFYPRSTILNIKMNNYLKSVPSHTEVYVYQLMISTLIAKSLKSERAVVEQALLVGLVNGFDDEAGKERGKLTRSELSGMLEAQVFEVFSKGEGLELGMMLGVANLVSFMATNLKQEWDWERYLENQSTFVKRRVLLSLILQKSKALNDNIVLPQAYQQFPHYQIQQKLTNQAEYTTTQQMQLFQSYQQALKTKSNAQKVNQLITNQHQYQVFLQGLFRRTSLSHTHLKLLIQRYKDVLLVHKEYDWTLINKIRNFWKKSYLNRQLYLQMMIKQGYVAFGSYVNYVAQLKDKDEREMVWIKIELTQLNDLFGNKKASK